MAAAGIAALVVLPAGACSGTPKKTWASFQEAGRANGWAPSRAIPPEISSGDEEVADAFASWVGGFEFASPYWSDYSPGSLNGDELRDEADSYPVENSIVPSTLRAAAKHLDSAGSALDRRSYGRGKTELGAAAKRIASVQKMVVADWKKTERSTGLRLSGDGVFPTYVSDELTEVEEWIDGDTVLTALGKVRLIGLDTPEMSDKCSKAVDAREFAEYLVPPGTEVRLSHPYSVADADRYGRLLRYVDREDGTDIGYSLVTSRLARARYDSRDGYQYHPRERAYRNASAEPDRHVLCDWADDAALVVVADSEDSNERSRKELLSGFKASVKSAAALPGLAKSAHGYYDEQDRWERESQDNDSTGSSGGGSVDIPDWLCPTRWC
jgi:endonuclease YncB( thermonuclease family)